MSVVEVINPLTFLSHGIRFVKTFEEALAVVESRPEVKEFFIVGDNSSRPSAEINQVFKRRNGRVFRIRPAGPWNSFFRAVGEVEAARAAGEYPEGSDLMFISLIPACDFSAALKRHRAIAQLSCREMYWLDTLKYGTEQDDIIALGLRTMPCLPAPVKYNDLTLQQRFDLSAFEFTRFMRPIHCTLSVSKMMDAEPFYTTDHFGDVFKEVGTPVRRQEVA